MALPSSHQPCLNQPPHQHFGIEFPTSEKRLFTQAQHIDSPHSCYLVLALINQGTRMQGINRIWSSLLDPARLASSRLLLATPHPSWFYQEPCCRLQLALGVQPSPRDLGAHRASSAFTSVTYRQIMSTKCIPGKSCKASANFTSPGLLQDVYMPDPRPPNA